jgi:hypothetical protein
MAEDVGKQVSRDRARGVDAYRIYILTALLACGCGSVTPAELDAGGASGVAGSASSPGDASAAGSGGAHGEDARAGLAIASDSGDAHDVAAELAPQPLPPCPGLNHLEQCPHGGTVAGKAYAFCYSSCSDLAGEPVAACDNNNGACVASCGACGAP